MLYTSDGVFDFSTASSGVHPSRSCAYLPFFHPLLPFFSCLSFTNRCKGTAVHFFFFLKTHDIRFYLLIFLWQDSFLSWILWDEKGRGERGSEGARRGWVGRTYMTRRTHACVLRRDWSLGVWERRDGMGRDGHFCYHYSYNYYSATTSTDQYRDSTERQFRHSVEEGEEEDGRL